MGARHGGARLMATIHAWFAVHERGCEGTVHDGEGCSEGCEWEALPVVASFNPDPRSGIRERIQLARMAAIFKARELVREAGG